MSAAMAKLLLTVALVANILLIVSSKGTSSKSTATTSGSSATAYAGSSSGSESNGGGCDGGKSSKKHKKSDFCDTRCPNPHEVFDPCPPGCPPQRCGFDPASTLCGPAIGVGHPDCKPGCRCVDGYVRDNDDVCIPRDQCPVCGDFEIYSTCVNGGCYGARTCSEKGRPTICVDLIEGACKGGCICQDGYLRDEDGDCIPEDQCPSTNATCSKANEEYDPCPKNCPPQTCDSIGEIYNCPLEGPDKPNCQGACRCKSGYYRNAIGECITEAECQQCTGVNEYYDTCPPFCSPQTCATIGIVLFCPAQTKCEPGCRCLKGYFRDSQGTCILEKDCKKECPQPNEEYVVCPVTCPPQTCEAIGKTFHCPQIKVKCNGEGSCRCKSGYYRNALNECISKENCLKCSGPNEFYSCGGACDNVCATLSEQNQTNCPIVNIKCNEMCYCKEGYARDDKNICIPIDKCPISPGCNGDPNAHPGCGVNCGKLCSNYDSTDGVFCSDICNLDGCDCNDGYVHDESTGLCVLPEQCPSPGCNGDPNAHPGCGVNCGKLCSNYDSTDGVFCSDICYPDACDCNDGYVLDESMGLCVLPEQCPPPGCNGDPNAHPGCGVNCGKLCSNYDSTDGVACSAICYLDACDCNDGYVLDESTGFCVLPEQCPSPGCNGDPNAHSGCGVNCGRLCSNYNSTERIACIQICYLDACDCNDGYVFDGSTGLCVVPEQCPSPGCNGDPNAHPGCGVNCGKLCSNYDSTDGVFCSDICNLDGCDCNDGYVLNENTGRCVLPEQCPSSGCNGDPNAHSGCGVNCGQLCSNYDSTDGVFCSDICYPDACDCNDGYVLDENMGLCVLPEQCPCGCNDGYVLDESTGLCVLSEQCPSSSCNGDPNAHPGCGVNCGKLCSNYDSTDDVACIDICYLDGCDCNDGYVLDENAGCCVLPEQCPSKCGVNEEYSTCIQSLCRNQNCTERGQPILCPRVIPKYCKKGCVCKDKYLRSQNGTCVPEDECDTCPEGEIYNKCPPEKCDAENCPLTRDSPTACKSPKTCGEPRCTCGYLDKRNRETGQCVRTQDCPPFECNGPNEEYQTCPPGCPGEECSDYINNSTCDPRFRIGIVVPCKPQCRCKEHYYRNCKGICIKASQCLKEATTTAPPKTTTEPWCGTTGSNEEGLQQLIKGTDLFTIEFVQAVLGTTTESVIMSAFSLEILLAELALYATGNSFNQLIGVLNLDSKDEIRQVFKPYLVDLKSQSDVQFDIAAKAYVNEIYELSDAFKQDTGEIFGATAENIDCSNPTQAASTMNQWVEDNTNNLIQDLVSPDMVTPDSVLFLLDAIYFKATWRHQFNVNNTEDRDFYVNNNTTTQVKTMYQQNNFFYTDSPKLDAKILSMPYENPNFTCLFFLPNDIEGLIDLVVKMQDTDLVNTEINSMANETVKVWIPKSEIETTIDLVKTLQQLKVTDIFDASTSGLDGILTTPADLYVSSGVQKAYIKMDEEGSEAAAANVIGVGATAVFIPVQELEFDANHPFLIFIREGDTTVFCGAFRK